MLALHVRLAFPREPAMPSTRAAICVLLAAALLTAQPRTQRPEPYAATLSRLEAMTTLPLAQWRSHGAMPHGEDPSLDDSTWTSVSLSAGRGGGRGAGASDAWYRTTLEIPQTAGGRDLHGARIKLQVRLSNDGRVFFNGGLVAQGDGRTLDPDRKSTRLNSSHLVISYAVFCLKKKNTPSTSPRAGKSHGSLKLYT